jgi:hypothetical protein
MGRVRTGWRLAKASFQVLRNDRSLAIFPLVSFACAVVAFNLITGVGIAIAVPTNVDWLVLPFMALGGYAATYFIVYFNVALAGAVRLSIDGHDSKLSDGLAVARERREVIAKWAGLMFLVWTLLTAVKSALGNTAGARLAGALISGIGGAAWSVATFFVIPVLAFEDVGPKDALRRSTSLVRERWGEGLVGNAAIGTAVFLVGVVPFVGLIEGANALYGVSYAAGTVVGLIAFVVPIATFALGSALGIIFRVELYRYTMEGSPTRHFGEDDMVAAFRPTGGPATGAAPA